MNFNELELRGVPRERMIVTLNLHRKNTIFVREYKNLYFILTFLWRNILV